ncbi:MAG: hypothetical protein M0Q91_12165 [Methanoregula sp.]|jgi:hypothetical protein|nr:hypothetical protein [Methanoregula sp.]
MKRRYVKVFKECGECPEFETDNYVDDCSASAYYCNKRDLRIIYPNGGYKTYRPGIVTVETAKETIKNWFATCDLPEVSEIEWVLVKDDTPVDVLPFPLETWIEATEENIDKFYSLFRDWKPGYYFVSEDDQGDWYLGWRISDVDPYEVNCFAIYRTPKEVKDE